jgi:hypothetical protein
MSKCGVDVKDGERSLLLLFRNGFKTSDCVRGQGASRVKSAAYKVVCEHFESVCNAAIGHQMGFCNHF